MINQDNKNSRATDQSNTASLKKITHSSKIGTPNYKLKTSTKSNFL